MKRASDLRMKFRAGVLRDDKESKPASQQADFRAFAALTALREHVHWNFEDMSHVFLGALLTEGNLYMERSSAKVFLCMGFVHQAALFLEVELVQELFFFCVEHAVSPRGMSKPSSKPWTTVDDSLVRSLKFTEPKES